MYRSHRPPPALHERIAFERRLLMLAAYSGTFMVMLGLVVLATGQ